MIIINISIQDQKKWKEKILKKMCGIIAIFNTDKETNPEEINKKALMQFQDQKERGIEGFGIIKIKEDKTIIIDRATEGHKFTYDIHQNPVKMIMVHHRIPTSSKNLIRQTHPISIDNSSLKYKY